MHYGTCLSDPHISAALEISSLGAKVYISSLSTKPGDISEIELVLIMEVVLKIKLTLIF